MMYLILEQGASMKLTEKDLVPAYDTLVRVGDALQCDCSLIHQKRDHSGHWVAIVMMRKRSDAGVPLEIRVACTFIQRVLF